MIAIKFHVYKEGIAIATILKNGNPVGKMANAVYEKDDLKFLGQALTQTEIPKGIRKVIISAPSQIFSTAIALSFKDKVDVIAEIDPKLKGNLALVVFSNDLDQVGDTWDISDFWK